MAGNKAPVLVEFEIRGSRTWVNPVHVVAVREGDETEIILSVGTSVYTELDSQAVVGRLTEAALSLSRARDAVP